jgi:dTDP-4-amino-4,6-dideoxygalactose transaminase
LSFSPGQEFELGDPNSRPRRATVRLLSRAADEDIAARRRYNYAYLSHELDGLVDPVFPKLPGGAAPIGFPIWIAPEEQEDLYDRLELYGVVFARFWVTEHDSLTQKSFKRADYVRTNSVVLPAHQELRQVDLERIVVAVRAWSGAGTGAARNGPA